MRDNNFDAMRLTAALAVVLSHSFPLSYGASAREPLFQLSHHQVTLGGISVYVFFIVSGYLITGSYQRHTPTRFVVSRMLRLLPGLAVVLLVLAFLLGPILTTLPVASYFGSAGTYWYVVVNLSLAGFTGTLPGVFGMNPYHAAVDGSLWTLRYEARCYLLILILGLAGILNRASLTILLTIALYLSWRYEGHAMIDLGTCFLGGAAIYAWQPPLRSSIALACTLLWTASLWWGFRLASATVGAYVVLYIGLSPTIRLPKVTRWGDLSYGVYIWAFPTQQIVTQWLGASISWYLNVAVATPIVLTLAGLSWWFVESPCLSLKARAHSSGPVSALG